jgi:hypothetical protein
VGWLVRSTRASSNGIVGSKPLSRANLVAEKHHIRFHEPAPLPLTAFGAGRHEEDAVVGLERQLCVAVSTHVGVSVLRVSEDTRVALLKKLLKLGTRLCPIALEAAHDVCSAMQIDDSSAARLRVQSVHVLQFETCEQSPISRKMRSGD